MKKILLITLVLIQTGAYAQRKLGMFEKTPEVLRKIDSIPSFQISTLKAGVTLPSSVDNTQQPYFRPIFNQRGQSCSQAAGTGYVLNYEWNCINNTNANSKEHQLAYHFPWNYVNEGEDYGGGCFHGWDVIKDMGCATRMDFDDEALPESKHFRIWMNGYDKYYRAMQNQMDQHYKIDVTSVDGINQMRRYLYDHGDGRSVGGVMVFSGPTGDWQIKRIPSDSEGAGKSIFVKMGVNYDHAMTIAGYNDNIRYDVNRDGKYTNDIDINGDGKVNLMDWEIGAFLVVNSWGTGWENQGKCYILYGCMGYPEDEGGTNGYAYIVEAKKRTPKLTLKVNMTYDKRNDLSIYTGVADDIAKTSPERRQMYGGLRYKAGSYYMQGGSFASDKTIEIGLDATNLIDILKGDKAKVFLQIYTRNGGTGKINSWSVLDYRKDPNHPVEYVGSEKGVDIKRSNNFSLTIDNVATANMEFDQEVCLLGQNYPNPVVNSTMIPFGIDRPCHVRLEVLNQSGNLIDVITDQQYNPGQHKGIWNVDDTLPKGIYYYRLIIDGRLNGCKKMILIK
ncbi:hypothetical protein DMA11_14345 [Marinilabiliaceae bacterium JC017]|nr:hypothetical protein DMA11_14345 [Marinilabiliaceae bacterium JC017]